MYWLASGLMLLLAVGARMVLPRGEPEHDLPYRELFRSLLQLIREHPTLREAAAIGALEFAAFSAFWSTLAFFLTRPPYHYGSDVTGLFGLVGIVGALAAPVVGRLADRQSPRQVVRLAVWITIASYLAFWLVGRQIWGLVLGVILLDLGVQAAQVSNQARIYRLVPNAHSRVNTVYMVAYFIGGSLGSILGASAWGLWGWSGVCLCGALMLGLALIPISRPRAEA
jgi:predicted MFS family arabinose efflux permease